jgi:hypothetical protein
MRSSIITLVLLLSIGVSWAGDRNRIIALGVRNFTYTPKEGKGNGWKRIRLYCERLDYWAEYYTTTTIQGCC